MKDFDTFFDLTNGIRIRFQRVWYENSVAMVMVAIFQLLVSIELIVAIIFIILIIASNIVYHESVRYITKDLLKSLNDFHRDIESMKKDPEDSLVDHDS